ncbi:MAG TPA: hypothetical protein VLT83_08220 [Opitutaceae bacterium]|nr:hypothetical protein [Opitutaceae bacterium]
MNGFSVKPLTVHVKNAWRHNVRAMRAISNRGAGFRKGELRADRASAGGVSAETPDLAAGGRRFPAMICTLALEFSYRFARLG